jgi:hypothetical protein
MKRYAFSTKPEKVDCSSQPPFVKPLFFQETLNHLIRMGMTKGWKQYTWERVQALENDPHRLFTGITQEFLQGINNAKAKIRVDQELQTDRDQTATPALRTVGEAGGSEVAAGTTPEVIGA